MLTPQELRDIPEEIVPIFEECEDEILRLIGERIKAVGYLNTVSMWQLIKRKESLLFKRNVTKTLSRYTGLSQRQIRKIFKKAGAKALLHDDTFLKAITTKKTRKRNRPLDRILKQAYNQTNGTLKNWTGTTATNATNHFVHAMDKAALQVQSGAFSYDEAIRRATRDLADHMDYVTYESGHSDTLEVASRRAVRTGVNQMASKLTLERCREMNTEFVETTAHSGARTSKFLDCSNHSWWQGKVFHLSKEGAKGEDGKFYPGFYSFEHAGYGYGEGICGWNCRHSFHPFIPGVSEPIYTPEELEKLNEKNIEYDGKKYSQYEIDQKQRGLERQVRKYKRRVILAESVGDEQEAMRNKAFVRKYQDELDKFTKETGNRRDYERERETVGRYENEIEEKGTIRIEEILKDKTDDKIKSDPVVQGTTLLNAKTGNLSVRQYEELHRFKKGFGELSPETVVNTLRKDSKEWESILNEDEKNSIRKYAFSKKKPGFTRLFDSINSYLRGDWPGNATVIQHTVNISSAIKKFQLRHNVIAYRNENYNYFINYSAGDIIRIPQFYSTSVTKNGAVQGMIHIKLYVHKGTRAAYIERLSADRYKKQRELLIDKDVNYRILSVQGNEIELEVLR